jgi:hypothetical protein
VRADEVVRQPVDAPVFILANLWGHGWYLPAENCVTRNLSI